MTSGRARAATSSASRGLSTAQAAAACVLWLSAICAAPAAQTFYKSVLPNGRIVYSDEPVAGAKHTEEITVQTDTPGPDAEGARRALERNRQQLLRDAAARSARLAQLETDIADAYRQLKAAEEARDDGRAIQEGDRAGRRLLASYGERQRKLAVGVREARQRLDRLLAERAELR